MARNLEGLKLGQGWNKGLNISGMSGKKQSSLFFKKLSERNKMPPSLETRKKMSLAKFGKRGEFANRWEGGKTKNQKLRMLADYKEWRLIVLKRDDYTCQICLKRGGKLNVDHIKSFSKFPHLRLDINNGRTLCVSCHKNTPTYCRG